MTQHERRAWPWRRIIPGILLVILVIIAALAAYIFWPVQVDLAHLAVPSDRYDVRILRDSWGVPHIFGQTDADAAYGLAYAHAEDDFLTIQQSLVAARGWLARVYGADSAANDFMVQLLRIWDVVEAGYESDLRPETHALVEAYADGINHYAALHPDDVLLADIFPITGELVVAASVHKSPLFFGLDDTLGELFADERQSDVAAPERVWSGFGDYQYGSNTLAIGPSRTVDGSTFFAVNSHQPWSGPVTWYEAHLHSEEGLDVVGGLFPATPVVIHGHNRDLGWAFTVNHADLADVYVLTINPDDPNQYWYDDAWHDLEVRPAPIRVNLIGRLEITVTEEALWSAYGPVVRRDHGTYALRYAGFGRVDIFEQLYDLNRATNFEEWQTAMYSGALPTFNVGYADREGNVYYLYNASIPMRPAGWDWSLYLPGESSDLLWTDYLPHADLPQVLNPPSGFVQNANSSPYYTTSGSGNPDPADFPASLGIETYPTNRAMRFLDLISADESITFEEFRAYKFDETYHSESDMAELVELVLALDVDDPLQQQGQALLAAWDFQAGITSTHAALPIMTLHYLADLDPEIKTTSLAQHDLSDAPVAEAFAQAVTYLDETYDRLDPVWGDVQRLRRGDADLPIGGGPDVPHSTYSALDEDDRLRAYVGDSFIMLIAWKPDGSLESYSIHQYGSATMVETSPHYNDQAPLFTRMELKPVWLDEADILANLGREYRPGEE
jgi:acyl-homoserine-lactone acylase